MNEVLINTKGLEIEDSFEVDLVSIEDIIREFIEVKYENKQLKEKIEKLNEKLQDVKPINMYASLGINESDYH